ncbi:hypothetical protein [Latilactobacillus sakei]|uniref:hypothetical protein n=1 Tax=Latilactobacillus sakei TaxID=1599 RepID=UPI0024DF536F|nr:hypothetical protein [Latilactobacillus sakei]
MVRESNPETTDPRVQRTKQQLRRALVELLKTATTKEISIQAITKQAQITRGLFTSIMKIKRILFKKQYKI